jgi:hypothetical protein
LHLDESTILQGLRDLFAGRFQERPCNLPQRHQLRIPDILPLVLRKAVQKNGAMGSKSNKQAKATSLALSWPRNTLLDDPASKIGIDRSLHGPLDGNDETGVGNAVLTRELGERPGLEDA